MNKKNGADLLRFCFVFSLIGLMGEDVVSRGGSAIGLESFGERVDGGVV